MTLPSSMQRAAQHPGRHWTYAIVLRSRVLTLAEKVVYLHHVELDWIEKHAAGCTMSAVRMADELNLSRQYIYQVRAQLVADGLLIVKGAGAGRIGHWYAVLPPAIGERPAKGYGKREKRAWLVAQGKKLDEWIRERRKSIHAA